MTAKKLFLPALMVLFSGAALAPAWADRAPNADQRSQIEQVLKSASFQRWEEIEFDDGQWEVDDAVAEDGARYDLKLDSNYSIVGRDREDDD